MSRTLKTKKTHLTFSDRQIIEAGIRQALALNQIAAQIGKSPSTISREIQKHRKETYTCKMTLGCDAYKHCLHGRNCSLDCPDYKPFCCKRRDRSPGVCDGCNMRQQCRFTKYSYKARKADLEYHSKLVSCRQGLNLDAEELNRIGLIVAPLLKKGHSPYMILKNHPEISISLTSFYNYLHLDLFKPFGVSLMDLRQCVSRKPRKTSKKAILLKKRNTPRFIKERTYKDFLAYTQDHPDLNVAEMDTVYNLLSGPYVQTFHFRGSNFLMGFYHAYKTGRAMKQGIDLLEEILGKALYEELCPILLPDRGSEFYQAPDFERRLNGEKRCRLFYCDPRQPGQKGRVEKRHAELRYILPKEKSFQSMELTSQKALNLVLSHLNSYPSKQYGGRTPFEMLRFTYPELLERLSSFGIREIPKDNVVLHPNLLRHFKN